MQTLFVETEGSHFQMKWLGSANPFFNPACFGTVQPYGEGSRIRAGFQVSRKEVLLLALPLMQVGILLLGERTAFTWALVALLGVALLFIALRNRNAEPLRAQLIEVLSTAARQATAADPAPAIMRTNGP